MGKRKAAWRKAKIEDVEETLEDDRLVNKLRKKGTSKKEAADVHDLFTVDTIGSGEGLSARTRREIARAKLFPPKGPNLGLSAYEEAKIARADRALEASKAPKAQGPEVFDIWSVKTRMEEIKESRDGSTVKRLPKPRPLGAPKRAGEKVSDAPAVLPAHEGQSINPLASSYEDIACIAAAKELEREKGEELLDRRKTPMTCELVDAFGAEAVAEMDEETKVQKYRSLKCKTGQEAEADAEAVSYVGKAAKVKRKSQAKRNRAKVQVHVEAKLKQIKAQRKMEKSVGQLGTMLAELKEQEEFYKERAAYRKALRAKRKERETEGAIGKCRRIGRARITEETIAVPDPDAAGKGLRSMSVKGSAIKERMGSFMRRGLTVPLPETIKPEKVRRKKGVPNSKTKKRVISPLLRENLMLT